MRIASFLNQGRERVGIVLDRTIYDVLEVQRATRELKIFSKPKFIDPGLNDFTIATVLEIGDAAMEALHRMVDFLVRYREGGDPYPFRKAAFDVDSIRWLPPVPNPPMMLGITSNSPFFYRDKDYLIPGYPQAFLRPRTSMIAHMQPVTIPPFYRTFRASAELGVVIGKSGREIAPQNAMDHVWGYTIVNDMASDSWRALALGEQTEAEVDTDLTVFTARHSTSLFSRGSDHFGPVGPWITTKEEVGDPYNLLIWNRLSGVERERSYTNAMVNGIEQTIHFLSGMFPLQAGSIIHMGTMSFDGYTVEEDMPLAENDTMEIEFERVGVLKNPVRDLRGKEEKIWNPT